jgi:hypothetical protein
LPDKKMMNRTLTAALIAAQALALSACTITREGTKVGSLPAAVQGSNDAQGSPLSVPGSGMGVGSGNPGAAEVGNAAGR